jgi:hypothetical protein
VIRRRLSEELLSAWGDLASRPKKDDGVERTTNSPLCRLRTGCRLLADTVAKVVLAKASKILRAAGAFFV